MALALSSSSFAQSEPIQVGKSKVHPTRLLARYGSRTTPQAGASVLQAAGLSVRHQYQLVPRLIVLDSAADKGTFQKADASETLSTADALLARIQALEESGLFEYVQPSYIYTNVLTPTDSSFTDNTLWGLRNSGRFGGVAGADIGAVNAWDITTGSTNVIVAVVDSGIRYTHQELASQMWRNPGETHGNGRDDDGDGYVDNVFGIDAANRSGDPMDQNDHGTHVAGTIGAAANDGHPHVGVAWKVRLMACKFLGTDGFGMTEDAIRCIDFAVRKGARVINASWGGGPFERALLDALTEARRRGVLIVAAAGNDFGNNDVSPFYPSSYRLDNIIAVAAVNRFDRLVSYSNYGAASVHIGAPGEGIYSCIAASDRSYDTIGGTSMAAPHVSGVAALLLARFPNASIPELRERILSTAVRIPTLAGKTTTGGRLNAHQALLATPDGVLELGLDPPEGSDLSARRPVPFYVTITDLIAVTNAVVRARVQDATEEVVFRNDGGGSDINALDEVYSAELTLPTEPGPFSIRFIITAPGKTSIERGVNYQVATPPLNDHFADALDLPPEGTLLQWANRFGTVEANEPKHAQSPSASASVWWNWTPLTDGSVIVDTAGSSFDTVVAVYTNSVLRNLREIAAADDSGNKKQGHVIFSARADATYRIAVAGFSAADVGTIRLRVEPGGGPDTTPPQVTITGPANGLIITNANDAKLLVSGTAADLAPNISGVRQVQVQVNRAVATTALGTTNWSSTVLLQEGQNRIKVSATDYAGNSSIVRTVVVQYDPLISPNDSLASAIELTGDTGTATGNSTRASKEPGEPAHAGNAGGKSVWWRFTPAQDGVLTLSTANSTFNTLLALYSGRAGRMDSLMLLGSNDDFGSGTDFSRLAQPVKGGLTYFIAVDGFGGSSGLVQLDYTFRPAVVYQLTVETTQGGSATPLFGFYEADARLSVTAIPDPFYDFDRWDGGVTSFENPAAFVMRSDLTLLALFRAMEFSDGFESGDLSALSWSTTGAAPWRAQNAFAQAGAFAARAGQVSHGQRSSLLLTGLFRDGTGSFGLRVSSEETWDTLDFYLDGRRLNRWSGEVGWTNFQFTLTAGTHNLEWRYTKDFLNTSAGLDTAFIDNVDLPFVVPVDESSPARLAIEPVRSGTVELTVAGQANQVYVIQSSSDLERWTSMATNAAARGIIRWPSRSTDQQAVFFRAIVPQSQ